MSQRRFRNHGAVKTLEVSQPPAVSSAPGLQYARQLNLRKHSSYVPNVTVSVEHAAFNAEKTHITLATVDIMGAIFHGIDFQSSCT